MPKSTNPEVAVLQDWRKTVDDTLKRIEDKIDNLDSKFAAKWVQTIVGGLVAAILLAFIGAITWFFIPHISHTTATTTTTGTATPDTAATTPAAQATANSTADTAKPTDSQSSTSTGGVTLTLPKVVN